MKFSRNDPCPCGSGKKYKKCCLLVAATEAPIPIPGSRFRFEPGSYGGPGRGFMPSALCYQRASAEQWIEHFCLVNPTCHVTTEEEASAAAKEDLDGAFAVKAHGGSDKEVAEFLRSKGYVNVDGFQRATE
jgi:hypothetical protein